MRAALPPPFPRIPPLQPHPSGQSPPGGSRCCGVGAPCPSHPPPAPGTKGPSCGAGLGAAPPHLLHLYTACLAPKGGFNPVKKLKLVGLGVTNFGGGGAEVGFPGQWLIEAGSGEGLRNKARAEGREAGALEMAKACSSRWNLKCFLGLQNLLEVAHLSHEAAR